MRRNYSTPILRSQRIELGVFGTYGDDGGNDVDPRPIHVIGRFELHLE